MTENINETDMTAQTQESSEAENTTAEDTSTSDNSETVSDTPGNETEEVQETYTIGQIFLNTYPPEAAIWCNNQGNCHIEETEPLTEQTQEGETITTKRYEIKANPVPTTEEKQTRFNKEFFNTSLGYIRRKVNMATGETKDFLSDLLPVISMGVQSGQTVPIITYSLPDFSKELTKEYLESLQTVKNVTAQFVQECFLQLSNDFVPMSQLIEE